MRLLDVALTIVIRIKAVYCFIFKPASQVPTYVKSHSTTPFEGVQRWRSRVKFWGSYVDHIALSWRQLRCVTFRHAGYKLTSGPLHPDTIHLCSSMYSNTSFNPAFNHETLFIIALLAYALHVCTALPMTGPPHLVKYCPSYKSKENVAASAVADYISADCSPTSVVVCNRVPGFALLIGLWCSRNWDLANTYICNDRGPDLVSSIWSVEGYFAEGLQEKKSTTDRQDDKGIDHVYLRLSIHQIVLFIQFLIWSYLKENMEPSPIVKIIKCGTATQISPTSPPNNPKQRIPNQKQALQSSPKTHQDLQNHETSVQTINSI